ncbi:MAG: hypothetical protein HC902_14600 [Calothrix sp. SM1_5_4]|nr:hypothetical protein [Calothrix sp. SM1_5_4]
MSKTELLDESRLQAIELQLRQLNICASIVRVSKDHAHIPSIFAQGLYMKKPVRMAPPTARGSLLKPATDNVQHRHTQVFSEVFELHEQIDTRKFQGILQLFLGTFGHDIYRMKGVIRVEGEERLTLIQIVRHMMTIEKLDRDVSEDLVNRFVIIAKTNQFMPVFRDFLKMAAVDQQDGIEPGTWISP